MAGVVRRTDSGERGQPARVHGTDDHVGVEVARGRGDAGRAAAPDHDVASAATDDRDLTRLEPADQGLEQGHRAPGERPRAEPLLEVRREPGPGGHVPRVVTVDRERVGADQAEPFVREPPQPLPKGLA